MRAGLTAWRMTFMFLVALLNVPGAEAVGHVEVLLDGVEVADDGVGRALALRLQPSREWVDGDDPLGAMEPTAVMGAETDDSAPKITRVEPGRTLAQCSSPRRARSRGRRPRAWRGRAAPRGRSSLACFGHDRVLSLGRRPHEAAGRARRRARSACRRSPGSLACSLADGEEGSCAGRGSDESTTEAKSVTTLPTSTADVLHARPELPATTPTPLLAEDEVAPPDGSVLQGVKRSVWGHDRRRAGRGAAPPSFGSARSSSWYSSGSPNSSRTAARVFMHRSYSGRDSLAVRKAAIAAARRSSSSRSRFVHTALRVTCRLRLEHAFRQTFPRFLAVVFEALLITSFDELVELSLFN